MLGPSGTGKGGGDSYALNIFGQPAREANCDCERTTDPTLHQTIFTRLVESGVKFVTLNLGGWDTHSDNFSALKNKQLSQLDGGLSGLFQSLALKGLLDSTIVYVTGEFGRTPKVNPRAGRDHYPRAMFTLLAGGGIQMGRVIGESDEKGEGPKDKAITPDDIAARFHTALGIDPQKEYNTPSGRPVMITRNCTAIKELLG